MDDNNPKSTWVRNEVANEVVTRVQRSIANGRVDNAALQQMMDLISGVENYTIWNIRRQGVIRRTFESERLRHNGTKAGKTATFATDLDDVVATFWEHIFKYLPRATVTGEMVPVRVVDGQVDADADFDEDMSKAGLQFVQRTTKCNPVHYLRNIGIMGIRNLINKAYRSNLSMVCDDCGVQSRISTTEDATDKCPKCNSTNTAKYWPDGNSSYRSRKGRKCNDCHNVWIRQFTKKCYACGSDNVRTEARVQNGDDSIFQIKDDSSTAEEVLMSNESDAKLNDLINRIYNFLPNDPSDPKAISKTKEVFNLMTRPEASKDMCAKCVAKAPLVCEEKCDEFKKSKKCAHTKIPDPNVSCGESSFSIIKCVNFSKKIGEYHGCSSSLAARRVKKVREYTKRYIQQHKLNDHCDAISKLMAKLDKDD